MKKIYFRLLITLLFLIWQNSANSQTPQFINTNLTGGANVFPFSSTNNRVQFLFANNQFTGAYMGMITHVYVRAAGAFTGNLTGLTITLMQPNITTLATGPWVTHSSQQVCLNASTFAVSVVANNYVQFPLTTPFFYDPSQFLLIDFSLTSTTGFTINQWTPGGGNRRAWGPSTSTASTGSDGLQVCAGIDMVPGMPGGGPTLPPIANFFPSVPNTQSTPIDTVWLNSPYTLVSTSQNASRTYWDLPNVTNLPFPYFRQSLPFTTQQYIDTLKYNRTFTYTFNQRGFHPVRLLAVNYLKIDSLRDSVVRFVYVDTPSRVPKTDFISFKRKVGFGDYANMLDLSSY
ncbi:MAG: hypothetical protein ACK4K9_11660, partial [Bacteroidia bacterium]